MKIILRNCSHFSETLLSVNLNTNEDPESVSKSTCSLSGVETIRREYEGYQWYLSTGDWSYQVTLEERTDNYIKLTIPYIQGESGVHAHGLWGNKDIIQKVILHYIDHWGKWVSKGGNPDKAPSHGDLSVDNVIVSGSNKKVFLIDWEHFSLNEFPIGFDVCYLLFESLWYEINDKLQRGGKRSLRFIAEQLSIAWNSGCLSSIFLQKPLSAMLDYLNSDSRVWGQQQSKYPILSWNDTEQLDLKVRELTEPLL